MKPYLRHGSNQARFYLQEVALSSAHRGFRPTAGPGSQPDLGYDRLSVRIGLGMKTQGIGPVFHVSDLDDALKYYAEVLGFKEDFRFGDYAGVNHGDACLHLCG